MVLGRAAQPLTSSFQSNRYFQSAGRLTWTCTRCADFRQAYDSINREVLYKIMLDGFGIPAKVVRLARAAMWKSEVQVRIHGELSESFETRRRLKQGDGLVPMLFNIALESVIKKIEIDTKGTL